MKREELKPTEIYARFASEVYDDFGDVSSEQEYYRKEHADSVMDAMEQRIKELERQHELEIEDHVHALEYLEVIIKQLKAEVTGYKASLERANFKMCEKDARIHALDAELIKQEHHARLFCDERDYAESQLRTTKRALWLARAERAKWVSENADAFKDYCDRHQSSHFHTYDGKMHFYEWTWKWELAERKCRDHADMFKEE